MSAESLPFLLLAFALGASIGSFLNVCIARWPHDLSVVRPPSRCPKCERPIRWHENIPLLGWLMLRGRCAGCRLPISPRYPLIELTVGLLWVAALWWFGPSLAGLRVAIFATVLLGIAATDLEHYLIPDGFTVFGFLFILATSLLAAVLGWESAPFAGPWDALIGACAGAGAIAIAGWLGEVALGREAMGLGDVTLMAMAGAALGPARSLLTIFVGAALATAVFLFIVYPVLLMRGARRAAPHGALPVTANGAPGDMMEVGGDPQPRPRASMAPTPDLPAADDTDGSELPHVPFGVFLAPAALVTLLWGDRLVAWYLSTMQ